MVRRVLALLALLLSTSACTSILPRGGFDDGPQVEWDKQIVLINRACRANPEMAELLYQPPPGTRPTEVIWVVDKGDHEEAFITAKPDGRQDPADPAGRGKNIREMLRDVEFRLPPGVDAVSSGIPRHRPPFKPGEGVVWRYAVRIHDPATGRDVCARDPGICYRTSDGGMICR